MGHSCATSDFGLMTRTPNRVHFIFYENASSRPLSTHARFRHTFTVTITPTSWLLGPSFFLVLRAHTCQCNASERRERDGGDSHKVLERVKKISVLTVRERTLARQLVPPNVAMAKEGANWSEKRKSSQDGRHTEREGKTQTVLL